MRKKIILFNGPKSSGKGIAVDVILQMFGDEAQNLPCKEKLMSLTQTFFMISEKDYWEIYNNRELKERPVEEFRVTVDDSTWQAIEEVLKAPLFPDFTPEWLEYRGFEFLPYGNYRLNLSVREAVIFVSELVVKPFFGRDWFGKARAQMIWESKAEIITDDSCGFAEELLPLLDMFGQDQILLIRVHRPGHDFSGDSREYVPNGILMNVVDVNNDGDVDQYLTEVQNIVLNFINEENK